MERYKVSPREECSRLAKELGDMAYFRISYANTSHVVIATPDELYSACYFASQDNWTIFYPYGGHSGKQDKIRGKTFDEVVEFFKEGQGHMPDREKIFDIKRKIAVLVAEGNAILDKYLGEDEGQFHKVVTTWECPESPFGLCVYNLVLDRAKDDCIYCHHPYERK